MTFFDKLGFYVEKVLDGSIGNGTTYSQNKYANDKGYNLENTISNRAKSCGFSVYRNLYIPYTVRGKTKYTEIDILLVKDDVLFVIESKNYNAKIVGKELDEQISATYNNGKVYNLYNPIKQNETHIWALANYLQMKEHHINSLIIFSNGADIKGFVHKNVINIKDIEDRLGSKNIFKHYTNNKKIIERLDELENNKYIQIKHRRDINKRK